MCIKNLIKQFKNDYDLGYNVRKVLKFLDISVQKIIKQYPNDLELGSKIREKFKI